MSGPTARTPTPDGSSGFGALLSYPNDPWTASILRARAPAWLRSGGRLRASGVRIASTARSSNGRRDSSNHRWIRGLEFAIEGDIPDRHAEPAAHPARWRLTLLQVNAHDGGRYQFMVTPQYERLEEDFEISDGVVLPAGGVYQFTRYQVEAQTADHRDGGRRA